MKTEIRNKMHQLERASEFGELGRQRDGHRVGVRGRRQHQDGGGLRVGCRHVQQRVAEVAWPGRLPQMRQ